VVAFAATTSIKLLEWGKIDPYPHPQPLPATGRGVRAGRVAAHHTNPLPVKDGERETVQAAAG